METKNSIKTAVRFTNPVHHVIDVSGSSETSFSIEAKGTGSLTGLSYTIPAHATGSIFARLSLIAMSSEDVKNLNDLALGMLNASQKEQIKEHEKISTSANLSIWSWFFGGSGASASYEKTTETMKSKGLTEAQITTLMDTFLDLASKRNEVEINFNVDNSMNDYSVSGDLYLYTLSGSIQTEKGTQQYRMLADKGTAGDLPSQGGAPAEGTVIALN